MLSKFTDSNIIQTAILNTCNLSFFRNISAVADKQSPRRNAVPTTSFSKVPVPVLVHRQSIPINSGSRAGFRTIRYAVRKNSITLQFPVGSHCNTIQLPWTGLWINIHFLRIRQSSCSSQCGSGSSLTKFLKKNLTRSWKRQERLLKS